MAKSKWETHVEPRLDEIYQWACNGLQDNEIYKNLNIGKNAFYQYLNKYVELKDALTRARTTATQIVENELFKSCTGYPYWEEVTAKCRKKDYNEEGIIIRDYEVLETKLIQKYSPAQVQAIQYYLNNKAKKEWASNPHQNELKKEEIELRKKLANDEIWE